jgi:ABC-type antimicrobial peptide transport system permease subunit
MQSAVANRISEIGTLRALGFKRRAILFTFLFESIFLSIIGGIAGLFFSVFMLQLEFSTTNFTSFSELAFRFSLSPKIVFYSLSFSVIMGILSGMIPAIRASKIKIVDSLRAN